MESLKVFSSKNKAVVKVVIPKPLHAGLLLKQMGFANTKEGWQKEVDSKNFIDLLAGVSRRSGLELRVLANVEALEYLRWQKSNLPDKVHFDDVARMA